MTTHKDGAHGEEVLNLMREFDLFAVGTLFKPKRKTWQGRKRYCNSTYMPKDDTGAYPALVNWFGAP